MESCIFCECQKLEEFEAPGPYNPFSETETRYFKSTDLTPRRMDSILCKNFFWEHSYPQNIVENIVIKVTLYSVHLKIHYKTRAGKNLDCVAWVIVPN